MDPGGQIECADRGMQQFVAQGVTCIHDSFSVELFT